MRDGNVLGGGDGDLRLNLELPLLSSLELAHYWGPELGPGTLAAWAAADRVGLGCGCRQGPAAPVRPYLLLECLRFLGC